ncbi:secreted RxLR effector protein 161-like [Bidens hawaiensis]|uniref:secreted RxLR effector protein 161-like n=1 Tax=Bidens hawaiensis TaxID=980011 RepID=UPI00404A02D0
MHKPTACHYGAIKRVLRYVAGTVEYGLLYERGRNVHLGCYTDSDWASSIDDRKSISAYVFSIEAGEVSWCSRKQSVDAPSSTEAEFVVANSAACQNATLPKRSKHIDIKYHYIKELPEANEVELRSCYTQEQVADVLTKALGIRTVLLYA